MQRRASSVCLRVLAMVLFASTLGHPVHAQSNDDDTLEYCYGNDCKSTKTRAIQAMEAAHPDYAGLFEEVDQQVTFQNGRVRPLSFTFRVRPRGPSETLPAVYTMDSASNPAPTYCAASGDPLSPNACGSESALIQGFVAWYEQLYGASRVRHAVDMKGGYVNPFAEVSGSGTAQEPLGQYRQNNWRNDAAMPEVTVTVYNANGTIAYGHGGTMRPLKFTTFRCLKGFHAKGGVNPGYDPGTSNPTEPGTECRPYIGDQIIHTRLRQTTCPPVEGADPKEGNPCSPATGDKAQYETDAEFAGQPFGRSYHSLGQVEQRKTLAPGWVHTYSDRIAGNPASGQPLLLMDGRGQLEVFVRQGTSARWTSETAANKVLDIEAGNTFKLTMQDGSVRRFDAAGRLIRIERLDDAVHIELAYESGRLALATDHTGRRLRFEYTNGRLTTLRLPDDRTVVYGYDSLGNLQSVTTASATCSPCNTRTVASAVTTTTNPGCPTPTIRMR